MSVAIVVMGVAACCGGASLTLAVLSLGAARMRRRRRANALGLATGGIRIIAPRVEGRGLALRYADALTQRLYIGATEPIAPCVRKKRAAQTRAGARYRQRAQAAGCDKDITVSAYCEARMRLALIGALSGALLGVFLSTELSVLLASFGCLAGWTAPTRDIEAARRARAVGAERHLSEMLEVVALGLRSGLTFDRSFEMYGSHFDSEFAQSCAKAHRRWSLGFATREEALHDLAASYDCAELARIVDSVIRSLRFGSSLAGLLEEAAVQSRARYRTALEERVAKAPVKMMLPTGTLILPAMLLLVMGPILLELAGGFK